MVNRNTKEDMVALEACYNYTNNKYTDELTNEIMDYLRDKLFITEPSDKDDIIYSQIWLTKSMNKHRITLNLTK